MVMQFVNARDMVVQVRDAADTTWIEVEGLDDIGEDPSFEEVFADKAVYTDGGNASGIKTQVGAQVQLSGKRMKDSITGAVATGQARCEALAAAVGYAGLGKVRWRDQIDTMWKRWDEARFSCGARTGDKTALRTWTCTIMRNGASTTEAVV